MLQKMNTDITTLRKAFRLRGSELGYTYTDADTGNFNRDMVTRHIWELVPRSEPTAEEIQKALAAMEELHKERPEDNLPELKDGFPTEDNTAPTFQDGVLFDAPAPTMPNYSGNYVNNEYLGASAAPTGRKNARH